MFVYDPSKRGEKKGEGKNSDIYEYKDQGPNKIHHLVKCIPVQNQYKLMEHVDEFALGFNNKHPFVLNYKGINIHEAKEEEECKYMVYIKMKAQKQSLRDLIKERKREDGKDLPLSRERVIVIFYSLASALAYLEEKDIVHSNIVHDSVLFDENDTVKLAGFAFSKYKPWKTAQKKDYQSYKTPERIGRMVEKSGKEGKKVAFKSDVWCLGKLIVDICLLQSKMQWQKSVKEANEKIKTDLEEVWKIYQDKDLTGILEHLLKEKRRDRPTFKDIRDRLKEVYGDQFTLIEMKNRKEEEDSILNSSLSTIKFDDVDERQFERDVSQFEQDTSVQSVMRNIPEKEESKEAVRYSQQEVRNMLEAYKEQTTQNLKEIKARIKEVFNYKIEEPIISQKNINGLLTEAKELLNTYKTCFNTFKAKSRELNFASRNMDSSIDGAVVAKNPNRLAFFEQEMVSEFVRNAGNRTLLREQENSVETSQQQDTNMVSNRSVSGLNMGDDTIEYGYENLLGAVINKEKNEPKKEDCIIKDRAHEK